MFLQHIYKQPQFEEDWFTYKALYTDMVRRFPSGSTFVEIGSWKGRSATYMATEIANSQKNINFYCIDIWESEKCENLHDIFLTNIEPVKKFCNPIKSNSVDASSLFENNSLDFVFIDASHDYEDVKNDIKCWLPKVRKKGILAGHDYQMDFLGVIKGVLECLPIYTVDVHQKCFIYYNE
jgi:predicted O-methyltransferase YrrM